MTNASRGRMRDGVMEERPGCGEALGDWLSWIGSAVRPIRASVIPGESGGERRQQTGLETAGLDQPAYANGGERSKEEKCTKAGLVGLGLGHMFPSPALPL
ncbi:hypothetical protein NDU88_003924 [Pleurodeles waltl]|uniref:Uncharacterized protein n=1 Tax=Pleurodeles waltl TaxID=8319 RepID=A0AAV7V224_PLEWA|nr:hypothetical protein NDU88_003924 [Pleurodeles waltl]